MRQLCVFGVALVAALSGSNAPRAQSAPSNQRVWTGTWEEHDSWEGRNKFGRSQAQITFVYVQGRDEFGLPRWESRRLTWSSLWEESIFDYLALELVGAPDERGFIKNRYPTDSVTTCSGSGTLELGPAVQGGGRAHAGAEGPTAGHLFHDVSAARQHPRGDARAVAGPRYADRGGAHRLRLRKGLAEGRAIGWLVQRLGLGAGHGRHGGRSGERVRPLRARARRDADLRGECTGRYGALPLELHPEATSRFPRNATNANVDDEMFFRVHDLAHLQDQYANDGPDFLFDSPRFDPQAWSRVELLVVETRAAQSAAVVTVTAMDYGAVGKLRAFVKSEDCGDWLPIPIRNGAETRDAVAIPMDKDNNLMADALEDYVGDPGRDEDAVPQGNGFAGDGFTAFEEYRGFMAGAGCRYGDPRRVLWHSRTTPDHKDLLVAVNALDLEVLPGLRLFEYATDLHVLTICDQHMIDGATNGLNGGVNTPQSRVVNFTLQQQGLRVWNGHRISQEPQRGVAIRTFRSLCQEGACNYGLAQPVDEKRIGPPKLTQFVTINDGITAAQMAATVVHEMGHAVGIPHHSEDIGTDWQIQYGRLNVTGNTSPYQRRSDLFPAEATYMPPVDGLLVDPGSTCSDRSADARYENGRFVGCHTTRIVRRGEQNSGDFHCPIVTASAASRATSRPASRPDLPAPGLSTPKESSR